MRAPALVLGLMLAALVPAWPAGAQQAPEDALPVLAWRALPEALRVASAQRHPVLVYVQAPWCGPCRRLERETLADPAVRERLARFALARLTLDAHDVWQRVGPYRLSEAGWAARLGAERTPTLVLLGPDGALLGRHIGLVPPEALAPILEAALEGSAL